MKQYRFKVYINGRKASSGYLYAQDSTSAKRKISALYPQKVVTGEYIQIWKI